MSQSGKWASLEIFYIFASWPGEQILYLPALGDLDQTVAGTGNLVGHEKKTIEVANDNHS